MLIGRKIYYDKITGTPLVNTGEGSLLPTTIEDDFFTYSVLNERNPESVGVVQLEYGQYTQDFAESGGYRVNVETKTLEFSYPDPNAPEEPPVFQKPLTEQILQLKETQIATNRIVEGQGTSQQDLLELLIDMGVI